MPGGGIEPPQAFWALRILSPLRLPISPSRQIHKLLITSLLYSSLPAVTCSRKCDRRNAYSLVSDFDFDPNVGGGVFALDLSGPAIVNGMMFVNTGYRNAMAGNMLLASALEITAHSRNS